MCNEDKFMNFEFSLIIRNPELSLIIRDQANIFIIR